jgi:hypothetical protein
MGRCELRKARQRGVVLANPNVGKMNTEAAAARDAELKPILETMWELPYREIAEELTNRNIPTPRGGYLWNAMTVMRVMKRLGIAGK